MATDVTFIPALKPGQSPSVWRGPNVARTVKVSNTTVRYVPKSEPQPVEFDPKTKKSTRLPKKITTVTFSR